MRSRRRSDAERLLPLGRLLLARRGQAAGDAVVRHGFECRIRFRDCRRRAVQLWKLQYELGGGRFNEAIQVLNRYVAQYPRRPCTHGQELLAAAYYNSHNYDEAYEIIASYPDPDGDLLAAKQKIAYFRGLSALERAIRRGRALSGGVRPYRNQSQIQCAGNLLAG